MSSGTTSPSATMGPRLSRMIGPVTVFAVLIGIWYAISDLVLDQSSKFLLPPPHEVLLAVLDAKTRSDLLAATWVTSKAALIGLLIAFVLGSLTAIAMAQARWIQNALYPYVILMQTIPILAVVPVIGFWFGYDLGARVIVCVIISIFPLVINPLQGMLGVSRGHSELFSLVNASRWTRLVKLQIPNALPGFFVGLQSAAGLAVTGSVVGDFYFGRGEIGLGLLLSRYSSRLESAEMLATVFMACLLGLVAFWIFGALGRRVVGSWSEAWGAA